MPGHDAGVRVINPAAHSAAQQKDAELRQILARGGQLPPLFCVPVLVKDNYDVLGLASTAGSVSLVDNFPAADAAQVSNLQNAGAVMLAKTNMGEFAISPLESRGSLFGVVRNPYDTNRTTAGSSGGSAAAVAASFGLVGRSASLLAVFATPWAADFKLGSQSGAQVGIGTDTGDSVRGPASDCACVGIRPTIGLASRRGIVPARLNRDVPGVLARTVEDTVRMFERMVGYDAGDPQTGLAVNRTLPTNYTQFLAADGLLGARLGVVRSITDVSFADAEVMALYDGAILELKQQGAQILDDFKIGGNKLGLPWDGDCGGAGPAFGCWDVYVYGGSNNWESLWACLASFKEDLDRYLANAVAHNPSLTYKSLQEIVAGGGYDPSIAASMTSSAAVNYSSADYPTPEMRAQGLRCGCLEYWQDECRAEFRANLIASMDAQRVDALIYPTWSSPPRLLGDDADADLVGNNSPDIAPHTGAPAITVSMSFTSAGLPLGLQFVGRPWDEATLISLAYAYEQATHHRRSPPGFPECAVSVIAGKASDESSAEVTSG